MMISMGRGTTTMMFLVNPKKREEENKDGKKAESNVLRATVNARGEVSSLRECKFFRAQKVV